MTPSPEQDGRIDVRRQGAVAVVVIDRPHKRNALTSRLWSELGEAVRRAAAPPTRCLVLRGAGGRAFSSGSDLRELAMMDRAGVEEAFQLIEATVSAVEQLPVPSIALLQGDTAGSALILAAACDLRVAASDARLSLPVARLGIALGPTFLRRLVALIGPARTRDLVLAERTLSGAEAAAAGLADYLLPAEGAEAFALDLAQRVAAGSPAAIHAARAALAPPPGGGVAYVVADEGQFREGLAAFLERRRPRFG